MVWILLQLYASGFRAQFEIFIALAQGHLKSIHLVAVNSPCLKFASDLPDS